jgi:hypothetical protein
VNQLTRVEIQHADGVNKKHAMVFQRVIVWLPPDLAKSVDIEAFRRVMPRSVAVEHIVKEYFNR